MLSVELIFDEKSIKIGLVVPEIKTVDSSVQLTNAPGGTFKSFWM